MKPFLGPAALCLLAIAGCKPATPEPVQGDVMKLQVTSTAFSEGEAVPKQYTGDGGDVSPPLRWGDPPPSTRSFALICEDPDAPRGTWVHWLLYNVPAQTRELPEAVPTKPTLADGAHQGTNGFGSIGYGGPAPPKGKPHRYYFKLYAVDTTLDLPAKATKSQLVAALQGHVVAEGELMGRYGR